MLLQCKRLTSLALSVHVSRSSVRVSLLIGRSPNADVNLVLADDRGWLAGWLIVADVAVKSFEFQVDAVYEPNIAEERVSLFRRLAPFFDDSKRIVLAGEWNAILAPKIERVRRKPDGLNVSP